MMTLPTRSTAHARTWPGSPPRHAQKRLAAFIKPQLVAMTASKLTNEATACCVG
jgi:hypothetical protein